MVGYSRWSSRRWWPPPGPPRSPPRPPRRHIAPHQSGTAAKRMLRRHLHDADAQPVRVGDPHLQQSPRLPPRLPQNPNAAFAELLSRRGQVAHLQPQRHARGWRLGGPSRQLQEPAAQEEDHAPLRPRAELAVDRQPQRVAVEHPAALRVGWVQQHAATQHVHGPMIAQPTPPGGAMLLQAAARREPVTLCREAFSSQAMAVLHDLDTRLTTSLPRQPTPNVELTDVCAGHRLGGAPRRNRTGDPILTMEP